MKIAEKNGFFSISFGAMDSARNENGTQGKARNKGLSVFAGDLRQNTETAIERKRKEIREKAVKVLQDKFDSDTKWSENIEESKERIQGAWDTIKEAKDNIAQVNEHIENAEDMDQGTYLGYQKYIAEQNRVMQEAQNTITGENAGIRSAKQDKLGERYRMTDAVVAEEKIFAAGSDEIQVKPLCIGRRDNTYFLASESCAIAAVGAEFVRDVKPGEIVSFTKHGEKSDVSMAIASEKHARCIFEYIYFARTDSKIDNINVYHARIVAGRALAQSYPVDADLVVGVPDSGLVAAKGYSEQSEIPYGMAFHKNSYVGRTFIKPKQSQRESSVKIKLNVIEEVVEGKRIVMVDDSIVRGTTSANIIKMLKKAGAKEVHVRISSPPFLYPCYFGTDVPSNEQLIAHSHTTEEIRQMIGADSLGYMEIGKLKEMVGDLGYCDACFTGNYPMKVPGRDVSLAFE